MDSIIVKIALIGVLGIGAQWFAWRTGRPAIAYMLGAGLLLGPVLGILNPRTDFGELLEPMIKLAVAVILFEGGLSLQFRELRQAGPAVARLILLGVPLGWLFCTLATRYGAGLSWELSALFGGILVVTGPTVIGPMLRAINLPSRTAHALKWEAIINDPIGALLAVFIFAWLSQEGSGASLADVAIDIGMASLAAGLIGLALGFLLTWMFPRGLIPEFLKAPVLLVTVIAGFVIAEGIQHELGLITVTVMGIAVANRPTFSNMALRRFKEDLTVLLVSGVFILMSATLDWQVISRFQFRFLFFLVLLMFLARPATVLLSLLFSGVPWRERLFIAWIAPRGIVAVAITSLFALRLTERGVPGAESLVPLAFVTAIATIVAHGFSARGWAARLNIAKDQGKGLLIIGVNSWSMALARAMQEAGVPTTIADSSKFAVHSARKNGLEVIHGDVLNEDMRQHIEWASFHHILAASDSDAYNALLCSELGPEFDFSKVSQVAPDGRQGMTMPRGNVLMTEPPTIYDLLVRTAEGWTFSRTKITEQFSFEDFRHQLKAPGAPVAVLRANGRFAFFTTLETPQAGPGDSVISFIPPEARTERTEKRREEALTAKE